MPNCYGLVSDSNSKGFQGGMDLGCLDICCVTDSDKHVGELTSSEISRSSSSKISKTKMTKESVQSTSSLNKFTSQIKKPSHGKASPLNWFPRKKVASYLERKIRMLQEVDGMNSSLDETLGDANPHYSRVLREKMAAKEAAHRAMEARKAAMVEASWCRILKAAWIDTKEAESLLMIAKKNAAEAFEAATALGVIMFVAPNGLQKRPRIHTSSADASGSTTHAVTASFETAFEVDREVAAAVKSAFTRLAICQSFSKDEFKDLLQRISQTPDTEYTSNEISEFSSGCESESGSEIGKASQKDSVRSLLRLKKFKKRPSPEKLTTAKLVDIMIERLQCLHEDELSSLATIVATCGLNAALAEVENNKLHDPGSNSFSCKMSLSESASAKSNLECYQTGKPHRSQESELPSLDKYLVKHMTKLEKDVETAISLRSGSTEIEPDRVDSENSLEEKVEKPDEKDSGSDLASVLVKHSSKLEKEIEEFKRSRGKDYETNIEGKRDGHNSETPLPSLDKYLVKHVSRLEKEVEEAKNRKMVATEKGLGNVKLMGKENRCSTEVGREGTDREGLENILVKPIHRLEREKIEQLKSPGEYAYVKPNTDGTVNCESLDKVLVRHVSRLESYKMRSSLKEDFILNPKAKGGEKNMQGSLDQILVKHKPRLEREKILAAASSQLEREQGQAKVMETRKEARDRELREAWGGMSLANSMKPHLSRLESEKAAWIKAEEMGKENRCSAEAGREGTDREGLGNILVKPIHRLEREKIEHLKSPGEYAYAKQNEKPNTGGTINCESLDKVLVRHVSRLESYKMRSSLKEEFILNPKAKGGEKNVDSQENMQGSLDQILIKHKPRLEREKILAAASSLSEREQGQAKVTETSKEAREGELRETWGGMSLGNSMKPHLSRLEREKAAWIKAEEEESKRKH